MLLGAFLLVSVVAGGLLRRKALYGYARSVYYSILFLWDGAQLLENAYFKTKSTSNSFKIPTVRFNFVAITEKSAMEELGNVPEGILSANTLVTTFLQTKYVMPGAYHGTTSSPLRNRSLALVRKYLRPQDMEAYIPRMSDELQNALATVIPKSENSEWIKVPAYKTVITILSRMVTRLFIGEELSRNEEYIDAACAYVNALFLGGYALSLIPDFLRPFMERRLVGVDSYFAVSDRLLLPVVEKRLEWTSKFAVNKKEKNDDFLQWYIDSMEAPWSAKDISRRFFMQNFETTESTGFLLLYVILELAAHPDCYAALRAEIDDMLGSDPTPSFENIEKMTFMDSFIKEVQRFHPMTSMSIPRMTLKPYTFANGTTVHPGEAVVVPSGAIHRNPEFYPNPGSFDAWRFQRKRENGDTREINEFVGSGPESLSFGLGNRKCPGRFFASISIKLVLIHLVRNFELKLEEGWTPKTWNFQGLSVVDKEIALLMKRKL